MFEPWKNTASLWFYDVLIIHLHNNGGISFVINYCVGIITEIVETDYMQDLCRTIITGYNADIHLARGFYIYGHNWRSFFQKIVLFSKNYGKEIIIFVDKLVWF